MNSSKNWPPWMWRCAGLVVILLFGAATYAPYLVHVGDPGGSSVEYSQYGFQLLVWGALAPMAGSIAWYANLPLAACLIQMGMGEPPFCKTSLVSLAIALSVLLPVFNFDFEDEFIHYQVDGPAVWFWIASFGVTAALGVQGHRWTKATGSPLETAPSAAVKEG